VRAIEVEDGLVVTFPCRNGDFDDRVEVGIALALMAAGRNFSIWASDQALPQINELAAKMRFRAFTGAKSGGKQQLMLRLSPPPSNLRLIESN